MINDLLTHDPLFKLLKNANMIGYTININYSKMTILTNDFWKKKSSGIPHNSFLIATAINIDDLSTTNDDELEIILLRVQSEYELPNSDIWLEAKIDKFKNLQSSTPLVYDEFSLNEMQYSGLECRVLGTFFKDENGKLKFGSDIENFYGTQILRVYKPSPDSLEKIVNFKSGQTSSNNIISEPKEIGEIRYTSSNRLQNKEAKKAKVYIDPKDFIARRTAMFGMTRTGKSNTVKTLIKAISDTAKKNNMKIAQIIYDINGEYANVNIDDKGSIASDVDNAQVFTLNSKLNNHNVQVLQFDFYSNLELAHEIIVALMRQKNTSGATDIETFLNLDISSFLDENIDPNDRSMKTRAKWLTATYKYILYKCLGEKTNQRISNPFSEYILKQLSKENFANKYITMDELGEILQSIHENRSTLETSSKSKVYKDELQSLINIAVKKNSNGTQFLGYEHLRKVNPGVYHNKDAENYIEKISGLVKNGKTIILDLSIGSEDMRNLISDKIARRIFNNNMSMYTQGDEPDYVIFYIEEAHNLIGKDMDLKDTWPRIAKEGAKYKIGLIYSTQEPSSINKNILSNTENWFVTHLNNEDELRTLSKFYDFSDFKNSLLTAKDVGFSRIKTLSNNFVIPVQIKLYESGD